MKRYSSGATVEDGNMILELCNLEFKSDMQEISKCQINGQLESCAPRWPCETR